MSHGYFLLLSNIWGQYFEGIIGMAERDKKIEQLRYEYRSEFVVKIDRPLDLPPVVKQRLNIKVNL